MVAQVDRAHKGIPLVFANLDGLSDDLLFRLLSLIRARQDGALAPIRPTYALTGERLLLEFVGSETSPIQPQFQYVIQAHDEETITHFCKKRIEAIQLQFHSEWTADEAIRFLYDLAQGDLNIIRAVLLAASEYRLEYDREREMYPGVRRSFFEQSLRRCATVPLYGLKLFQLARQTIQHHEDMLDLVEVLVDKLHGCSETKGEPLMSASCWNAASVSLNETRWAHYLRKPTPLELTGLVKRDSKTLTLKFSSRYAADFAYRYFTMQCRGDFLLRQRRFPEAIDRYRRTPDSGRERRPRNLTDFQIVRDGVHRLCRHFAETAVFPDSNGKFFAVFCDIAKYLLGFHDATMWRYRAEGGVWENVYNQVSHERSDILDVAPKHALALNNQTPKLFIERSKWPHVSAYVVSFDYPAKDSVAIVLEDAETSPRVSEWRSLAAARLAHHFLLAWCHSRDRHYLEQQRTKLGTALAHMFREETIEKSLQVLAKYLKEEVSAHAVRLFLAQNGNPNVITSRFQVGFESAERARDFDAGGLTLSRDRDPTMFGAADSRKPTMFRWIPVGFTPQPKGERPLSYKKVTDHPYAERVERKHGDYWIDFPLFKDGEFFGKLTLAFRSNQPPPDGAAESLENVFELLAQHIGNL
ncbi:MAG TPA: hypothetical protein VK598_07590, partial [Nitrospiraceae bacterium]|nr:hypothetical protein [Nitrospiraceae bacterium]